MITAVTGGRDRWLTLAELEALDLALFGGDVVEAYKRSAKTPAGHGLGATLVRHGDCSGADRCVADYLRARRAVEVEAWPAEWSRLGRAAGHVRNHRMLHGQWTDLDLRGPVSALVAFEGGAGTRNCCTVAEKMGMEPIAIEPVAEPRPWNRHHGQPTISPRSAEPAPTLYCGNGSPVANPWRVEAAGLRGAKRAAAAGEILNRYRRWLWARIDERSAEYDRRVVDFIRSLTPQHFAVCSCWPAHCHVEVVIAARRWLSRE